MINNGNIRVTSGSNSGTLTFDSTENLYINGGAGDDTFTIPAPLIYNTTLIADNSIGDTLNVTGTPGNDNVTIGGSQVTWGAATATFSGIYKLNVNLGAGNDTLTVTGPVSVSNKSLSGGGGSDKLIVHGDDTNETITADPNDFQWRSQSWSFSQFTQVEFDMYGGDDTLIITNGVGYSITFDGGTGTNLAKFNGSSGDNVYLANATTASWGSFLLTPRNCTVQFMGSGGNDTLRVTAPPQYPVYFDGGTPTTGIVNTLWLDGTSGNDTLLMGPDPGNPANIVATFNTPTSIGASISATEAEAYVMNGNAGDDTIGLTGPMSTLPSMDGGAGTDTLEIVGTSAADTASFTPTQIVFGALALTVAPNFEQGAFYGGAGDDNVSVTGALASYNYVPWFIGDQGNDSITIPGTAGNDAFGFTPSLTSLPSQFGVNGVAILASGVEQVLLNGGAGADNLVVTGTSFNDAFAVAGNQVTFGTTTITENAIEQTEIDGGNGNDSVTVTAALSVPLTFNAGGGDDTLTIAAAPGIVPVFNGGSGNDKWVVNTGSFSVNSDLGGPALHMSLELSGGSTSLTLGASQHLSSIMVTDGQVALAGAGSYLIRTSSLWIYGTGLLDLGGGGLIFDSDDGHKANDQQKLANYATQAYNGGNWKGDGLTSSMAMADPNDITTLAVMVNEDAASGGGAIVSTFGGESVDNQDVLVKYTYQGDANLDGRIDAADYFQIDQGYRLQSDPAYLTYYGGDFDGSGSITADDYYLIDRSFMRQGAPLGTGLAEAAAAAAAAPLAENGFVASGPAMQAQTVAAFPPAVAASAPTGSAAAPADPLKKPKDDEDLSAVLA